MDVAGFLVLLAGIMCGAAATAVYIRRSAAALRETEELYRSLVDLSPDGIGVTDENGRLLFVNAALARMIGVSSPADAVGLSLADFHHPDSLASVAQRVQTLHESGRVPPAQLKFLTRDGRTLDVETVGTTVRRGGKTLLLGFARDLTERKRIEAELEANERRLRALFDSALDAIVVVNDEGHYVDANAAASELFGYPREKILHMGVGDLTAPTREHLVEAWWRELRKTGSMRGEGAIVRADGTVRDVEFVSVANMLPGLHSTFMHDITARKEAERSVRQLSAKLLQLQDEERRRIARQLHDTTAQNLAALRMNLARAIRSIDGTNAAARESVEDSIALTEQSINEIRTLAYLLHPPMFDEAGLLPSLRWFVHGFEERSGITVTLDAPQEIERLTPELETAVFRIVQEALTNIQRHSGSHVARILFEMQPRAVHLEIQDEGRGLPMPLRGDPKMLTAAGVGIAGIQERVRELGGATKIESDDTGTTVNVILPVEQADDGNVSHSDR